MYMFVKLFLVVKIVFFIESNLLYLALLFMENQHRARTRVQWTHAPADWGRMLLKCPLEASGGPTTNLPARHSLGRT